MPELSPTPQPASASYIDWDRARRTARRFAGTGPKVSADEASRVVDELREAAHRAYEPVAQTARLDTSGFADSPVHVVDRGGWIDVNTASFSAMIDPVVNKIIAKRAAGAAARKVSGVIAGTETGTLLGWVSGKVLGQFDLAPGGTPSLLLVAPNIVQAERELAVDPHDFRLWVCLHEETHRVQFTAVPWLRDHMVQRSRELLVELVPDPDNLQQRLKEVVTTLPDVLREGGEGLATMFITPEQREELASITAIMSLLEGHADVVMDDVGPKVVPSVEAIRRKFDKRRQGAGNVDKLLRRLLGMEAKMRQYRDGAAFVRAVQDKVGIDGFNAIWTSPDTLPKAREIEDPAAWVARVHG